MLKYIKFSPYLSSFAHYTTTIPQKWVSDIKYVEFDELLSSSVGALALVFRWKDSEKNEFTEIASGMLSSSYVYGDPVGTIASIAALGYSYAKTKNAQCNFTQSNTVFLKGEIGQVLLLFVTCS